MAKFCSSCGGSIEPGQKYCMHCGAPVVEPQFTQTNANPQGAAPSPQATVITNGSPLSRAWNDLKSEKGLVGKLCILALITCVPIVNFFALGYFLMYGTGSALGGKTGLPEKIANSAVFMLGFFVFVINLVWGLVIGLASAIPLVGLLVSIAFLVIAPCMVLCQMRLGLFGSLGSAFELTKVWDLYRSNMGTTLIIYWAPMGIVLAASVIAGAVVSIFGGFGMVVGALVGDAAAVAANMGGLGFVGILAALFIAFVSAGANLVAFRAFGYFIAETAPQWVRDGLVANPQARV